jgi:two-component system chemotaxis response regulator CheB
MPRRDLVVVGASAGGVEALRCLVGGLPPGLPASVVVVLHLPSGSPSALVPILQRRTSLAVAPVRDGLPLGYERVYVAPPDRHVIVSRGSVWLTREGCQGGHRRSVDVLFRSAASSAGPHVIGVVLSGALDDGTAGLAAVKAFGGLAVVQDPLDALMPCMPENAMQFVEVDYVLPAAEMGALLDRLVREPLPSPGTRPSAAVPSLGRGGVFQPAMSSARASGGPDSPLRAQVGGGGCLPGRAPDG